MKSLFSWSVVNSRLTSNKEGLRLLKVLAGNEKRSHDRYKTRASFSFHQQKGAFAQLFPYQFRNCNFCWLFRVTKRLLIVQHLSLSITTLYRTEEFNVFRVIPLNDLSSLLLIDNFVFRRSWRKQLPNFKLQPERQQQQHYSQQSETEEIHAPSKHQQQQCQHVWRWLDEILLLCWQPDQDLQRLGLEHKQLVGSRRYYDCKGGAIVTSFQLPAITYQQLQQSFAKHLID